MDSSINDEIRQENKTAADYLLFYYEYRERYEQMRQLIIDSSPTLILQDVSASNKPITDPTGRKAVELVAKFETLGKWLQVVEEVEQKLPPKLKVFCQLRREYRYAGARGWTALMQVHYPEAMAKATGGRAEEFWVDSERTFRNWWRKIVNFTARLAAKRGLI